jgi:arylsulfatase A-like enzyme
MNCCPACLDSALSTLLLDLETRGLLDTTLVACISEHGRTPKITNVRGAGREHWSRSYCGLLAGGGVRGGQIIGRSDEYAADVAERPVSPKDVLATMYHLLGVPEETMVRDRFGRPLPLVSDGKALRELVS